MTNLMKQAMELAQALPENQQDQLARFLINEMHEDNRWNDSSNAHAEQLQKLTDKILADDTQGLCEELDPDTLIATF